MSKKLVATETNYVANAITAFCDVRPTVRHHISLPADEVRRAFHQTKCGAELSDPTDSCDEISLEAIPEYIRQESPSPKIAEALVEWFSDFYVPRIELLLYIVHEIGRCEHWEWFIEEANRNGFCAVEWVKNYLLKRRDEVLDVVSNLIAKIKADIVEMVYEAKEQCTSPVS
jgi:hypothetical protein